MFYAVITLAKSATDFARSGHFADFVQALCEALPTSYKVCKVREVFTCK